MVAAASDCELKVVVALRIPSASVSLRRRLDLGVRVLARPGADATSYTLRMMITMMPVHENVASPDRTRLKW